MRKTWLFFLLLLTTAGLKAQQMTEVYGIVTDAVTKQPMDYVNVRIVGTVKATQTDPRGEYRIRSIEKIDTLAFSYLGYKTRYVPIKRGVSQQLNIEMGSDEVTLTEIAVKAEKKKKRVIDTVANYVFYKVLEHKDENRDNAFNTYKYDCYEKTDFSLLNPPQKFLNYWIFKPFRFAFENRDTTEEGNVFIPGVMRETVSEVYYRKKPNSLKKFVKADNMTGVDNPSVMNMANYNFGEYDAYSNLFVIAQTSFIAPFANTAIVTYRYYLTDTARIDGRISYKLHFVGKVKEDMALKGYAWIDSATWAVKSLVFRPNEKANLNFVNDYTIRQDFTLVKDQYWMMNREEMNAVGSLFKKKNKMAILVTKVHARKNFEVDVPFPDSIFKGPEEIITLDSAVFKERQYFDTARFENLTSQEDRVYFISDTIKKVRAWKTYMWLGRFFTAAFADVGPISIGRVLNFGSRNNVEGWRVRFGFETNPRFRPKTPVNAFLRKFYFYGYGAYGFKDKDWKYQAIVKVLLPQPNQRWQALEAMYRYDMRVPGQDEMQNLLTFDNIVTLISGKTLSKIMKVREFRITYEKEIVKDISTFAMFNEKTYYDIPGVFDFSRIGADATPHRIPKFNVTQFTFDFRYCYKDQAFIGNYFYRYYTKNKYPVILFRYTAGLVDIEKDHYNYHDLQLTIKQRLFSPIGFTDYSFKFGKIFGKVPYTESYLTQGNLGILYDKFNYNLLREFEFTTDQYASFWLEHNFHGFFFNKIPGVNKLRLQEVFVMRSLWGTYSNRNNDILQKPTELGQPFPKPYIEMGFGIANIAYLFRVDFLWRLTYRNNPGAPNWGVKIALKPGF